MAYKFQLGNAKLGGTLQQDGGLVSTDVDDATAGNVVAQIDNGEIPIAKLAAKTISGKDLGGSLDNLTDGNGIADFTYNGSGAASIAISLASNQGLEFNTGELKTKVDANKAMEVSAQGLGVKVRANKGLGLHADGIEIVPEGNKGLSVGSNGIAIDIQSNKGLDVGAGGLTAVVDADALQLGASGIDLKDTIAGNRTFSGTVTVNGNIDCDAAPVSLFPSIGANALTIGHASSTIVMAGNLQVDGTLQNRSATEIQIDDLTLQLAQGAADSAGANGAGLKIDGADAFLTWDHGNTRMTLNKVLNATSFVGNVAGNATTATTLASAQTIGGVSFNGSAGIVPNTINVLDEENTNADRLIMFADGAGAFQPKNDGDFKYNPSTGRVTATQFAGDGSALTGVSATQIAVALKADGDSLVAGFNHIADMTSDGTDVFTLPASPAAGDVVYVKAPSDCASGRIARISKAGSQTIDGVASIDLVSPHAAVSLVYVGSDAWKLF